MKPSKEADKLDPGVSDEQSDTSDDEKVYKVRLNLIPVFILECFALGCLAVLAYFLRFTEIFPVFIRSFNPCDSSISYSLKAAHVQSGVSLKIPPNFFYIYCFASPLSLIILGEMVAFIFSGRSRKVVRAGCIPCKMHQLTRRIVRFFGTFLFGALATTILTDCLKLATGIQRPYFLEVCRINVTRTAFGTCNPALWLSECATDESLVREARMSFPSLYASLSSFSAIFMMVYIHCMMSPKSSRLLRPALVLLIAAKALVCCFSRVSLYYNSWWDVIAGIVLGSSISLYLTVCVLSTFKEHHETRHKLCCKKTDHAECRPQPLFFRYFRFPHVSYQGRSGKSYPATDRNNYEYSSHLAMPVNAAFQRDLHQRVEDYSKRHGKQAENNHRSESPKISDKK